MFSKDCFSSYLVHSLFAFLLCLPTPTPCTIDLPCRECMLELMPSALDSGPCLTCAFILDIRHAVALSHLQVPSFRLFPQRQRWHSSCLLLLHLNPSLLTFSISLPPASPLLSFQPGLAFTTFCGCVATVYVAILDVLNRGGALPLDLSMYIAGTHSFFNLLKSHSFI